MALPDILNVELCTDDYKAIVRTEKCQSCKYIKDLCIRCKSCKLELCESCGFKGFVIKPFICKMLTRRSGHPTKHDIYIIKELK